MEKFKVNNYLEMCSWQIIEKNSDYYIINKKSSKNYTWILHDQNESKWRNLIFIVY